MSRMSAEENVGMKDNPMEELERFRTSNTVTMTPELFEKLYLGPQNKVKGDLRKTFANPTPLGVVGFLVALTPLSCCLMGWRGAGGLGAANIGVFYYVGGMLEIICGALEFFLGNTFPFVLFTSYGAIFISLAATLHPFYGAAAAYSPTGDFAEGLTTPGFLASIAYFLISCAVLNIFFIIAALKVNIIFVLLFVTAGLGFTLLASGFWALAEGAVAAGERLIVGTGATWFVTIMLGWYLLLSIFLGIMGYSLSVPVGDLSQFWERRKAKKSLD